MSLQALIQILADGEFHSGESLGKTLGVSRAAVWKQLKKLEQFGLVCHSVKGRGYRVPGGVNLLDRASILAQLDDAVAGRLAGVELQLTMESTNRLAMAQAQQGNRHGWLYLAEQQTAGRGRRGREWVSPFAKNIYFSLTWSFAGGAAALEGLSLMVGLALVRALRPLGFDGLGLKWPNDLLCRQRKLAGVLLEMSGDASGLCQVVIGVGLNVSMPQQAAAELDQPWIDLQQLSETKVDRNRVLAAVLNQLVPMLQQFEQQGFAAFRQDWQQCNAYQQQRVRLSTERFAQEGVCVGVDDKGALLLEIGQAVEAFHGGELSLRPVDES